MMRFLAIITVILAMLLLTAGVAGASSEGAELRRIDTSNVNQATDIKAVVGDESGHEAEPEEHEATAETEHEVEAKAESDHEAEAAEEAHHPAWMIPGWQSIFTVLAVIYFGLGVTLLPYIMAKEEH